MELADILAERAVLICTDVPNKHKLLHILSDRAAELTGYTAEEIFSAVASREELGSTGLGNGIAVPHGKISGLKSVTAVFARLEQPIDFDAVDEQPVDLVVMLLAPIGAGADHLKALSRVARLLRTEEVVDELRRGSDPAALYSVLTRPVETNFAA